LTTNGIDIVLISGAPEVVLSAFQAYFPISKIYGLSIGVDFQNRSDGTIQRNPGLCSEKQRIVNALQAKARIVLAVGDSVSDIPALTAASIGVFVGRKDHNVLSQLHTGVRFADHDELPGLVTSLLTREVSR